MYEAKLRESKWTKNEKIVCDGDDDGRGSNKKPTQKYNNIQCVACKKKTRCHTHRKEKRKRAIRATDDVLCTPSPCQCIWCGLLSVIQSNRKCIVMYKYRKIVSRVRARAHTHPKPSSYHIAVFLVEAHFQIIITIFVVQIICERTGNACTTWSWTFR